MSEPSKRGNHPHWIWFVLVGLFALILLARGVIIVASAAPGEQGDAWSFLGILVGGTILAVAVPTAVALWLGWIRNRRLRVVTHDAFLVGSVGSPNVQRVVDRFGQSGGARVHNILVWSFDREGASLWQGVFRPTCIAKVPRSTIDEVLINEQYAGSGAGMRKVDCLELDIQDPRDGAVVILMILVRPLNTPWMVRGGQVVTDYRRQLVKLWGLPETPERSEA